MAVEMSCCGWMLTRLFLGLFPYGLTDGFDRSISLQAVKASKRMSKTQPLGVESTGGSGTGLLVSCVTGLGRGEVLRERTSEARTHEPDRQLGPGFHVAPIPALPRHRPLALRRCDSDTEETMDKTPQF